ncbi:MAG: hypothetical protein U0Y82_14495 [Thermoleophilia bacterium]
MRRAELDSLRLFLPALPTVVLGALPGPPDWAERLARIGVDVLASGAAADTPDTWRAARAAAPAGRVVKAAADTAAAAAELAAAGAVLVETAVPVPAGVYRLGPGDAAVVLVTADPEVEDPNQVARLVVDAAADTPVSQLWLAAGPGLDALPPEVVEAKLRVLCEAAYLGRLAIAKVQFELD